jgi:hypothetical protein
LTVTSLSERLDQVRAALAGASQTGDLSVRKRHARALMEAIAEIGGVASRGTSTEGGHILPEVAVFVEETSPLLRNAGGGLSMWLLDVNQPTFEDTQGYQQWLRDRSAIEYLRDLYRGTSIEAYVQDLDTEDLDELIRFKAHYFGGSGRPEGAPPHHWWWDL